MKILIATNNRAKIKCYKNLLSDNSIEFVTLADLNLDFKLDENGKTIEENSQLKAKSYSKLSGLITIADDVGLEIESIPDYESKNLFVKRINGVEKTDEELIEYYSLLFSKYGRELKGKWCKSFSIAFKDYSESIYYELPEIFVSTPCETRCNGYPLDSLTIVPKYNKYLAELTNEENQELTNEYDVKIKSFFNKQIEQVNRKQGIFIACPIGKYIKDDSVGNEYETFIRSIVSLCREYSDNVFIALEREQYGKLRMLGDTCTPDDYDKMNDATYLVAIPEDSMGVSVEIGWASAKKKDILLILDKNYRASEIVKHIHTVTGGDKIVIDTTKKSYSDQKESIFEFLRDSLSKRF